MTEQRGVVGRVVKTRASHNAASPTKRIETAEQIAARITGGEFGDAPSMRKVINTTGIRHDALVPIYKHLLSVGKLERNGTSFKLCN